MTQPHSFSAGGVVTTVGLFAFLVVCAYTDMRRRKIYNKIVFPGWVLGILLNGLAPGGSGWTPALMGLLLGLAVGFVFFATGGFAAGDAKLIALLGSFKGPAFLAWSLLFTIIAAGAVSLLLLAKAGLLARLGRKVAGAVLLFAFSGKIAFEMDKSLRFPYAVAILAGAFAAQVLRPLLPPLPLLGQ